MHISSTLEPVKISRRQVATPVASYLDARKVLLEALKIWNKFEIWQPLRKILFQVISTHALPTYLQTESPDQGPIKNLNHFEIRFMKSTSPANITTDSNSLFISPNHEFEFLDVPSNTLETV